MLSLKLRNATRSLIKNFNNSFHTSRLLNASSQYYPINDSIFNLTDEQKQVNSLKYKI
jgi:hypothetical protein